MALPTTVWYILFSFLPMFGLIIVIQELQNHRWKEFHLQPAPQ